MKFDLLLAQYLYQHKKLNLPGIGTFEASGSAYVPEENEKQKPTLEGVTFQNANITKADDNLIEFIKEQTGKMKPLAISDLESFLTLGKQFLYIGKPFYLEGIGTLSLSKDGRFDFTPGEFITTKLDDPNVERSEGKKRSVHEEDRMVQQSNNNTIKKVFLALITLAVIGGAGWAAYHYYMLNANNSNVNILDSVNTVSDSGASKPARDSQAIALSSDTAKNQHSAASTLPPGTYRFVVETTDNKTRAINRFGVLKTYGNKIQLETQDSIHYKLYYVLKATPADTARLRDSLNLWYYGNSQMSRVTIEQ